MSFSTDYNEARAADPNINSVADYRASLLAPTQNQISQTGNAPVSPNSAVNYAQRDFAKEQAWIEKQKLNPISLSTITPKTLFDAVYTEGERAKLKDYQDITQRDKAKADLTATARPTNPMMGIMERMLRTKGDPAKQQIGQSELYEAAGIPTEGVSAYTTLLDNLQQRSREMERKYVSFKDQVTQAAGSMANVYNLAADKYKILNDDYQSQVDRLQNTLEAVQQQEFQMRLIERQNELAKDVYKYQQEFGYEPDFTSSLTSDTSDMRQLGEHRHGGNCVFYNRSLNPNLPFGLETKADKKRAIARYGSTDMNNIQVGDSILTGEGKWGHAARVIEINGNKLILDEANYISGQITQGRTIDKDDPLIYGFVEYKAIPEEWRTVISDKNQEQFLEEGAPMPEGKNPGIDVQMTPEIMDREYAPLNIQDPIDAAAFQMVNNPTSGVPTGMGEFSDKILVRKAELMSMDIGSYADYAKMIVEGRADPPTSRAIDKLAGLNSAISNLDPNFDIINAKINYSSEKKLAETMNASKLVTFAGATGGVLNSLDELENVAHEIDNKALKQWNKTKLWALAQTGDPTAARYKTAYIMLQDELGIMMMQGNSFTDQTFRAAKEALDSAGNLDAFLAQIDEMRKLLHYRINVFKEMSEYPNAFTNIGVGGYQPSTSDLYIVGEIYIVDGEQYKYLGENNFEPQ